MHPRLRQLLFLIAGLVCAVITGWEIANESIGLIGLVTGAALLWFGSRAAGLPADSLVLGLVLVGYLIGNRGFAQLHVPSFPLLPAELALGLGVCVSLWQAVRTKRSPLRRDALNLFLAGWLICGVFRLYFDIRVHGFVAVRDFATLYYAVFFYLAQDWGEDALQRRWLERCLTFGFALSAPALLLFTKWPDFFIAHTEVFGTPLIFVKSDVAAALLVAGLLWFLWLYVTTERWRWLFLTTTTLLGIGLSNSRASFVGLLVACAWMVLGRYWRALRVLGALLAACVFLLVVSDFTSRNPWTQTTTYRIYETGASILDFEGSRPYESADLGDKPDNNRFRLIWWQAVVNETLTQSPWFGLGFGYDLADQFMRIYYPDASEEFTARSPHNFLLTVFGRMGIVGSVSLALFLGAFGVQTWRSGRRQAEDFSSANVQNFSLWVGAWGILVSACFGVVLEGPMGAVVFWTLLGLASARMAPSLNLPETSPGAAAALQPAAAQPEVAVSP